MGGGPGIQAEKITFKYLVDLYLIKELSWPIAYAVH